METQSNVAPLPELFREVAPGTEVLDPQLAPPLRWGILGAGGIARVFARDVPAYSSQIIGAVGSRDLGRARKFAAEIGLPEEAAYGSYEELVADPNIDVIYVATPHIRHRDDALLALRAGKPVLVEKSFTMTKSEAQEVFDEAERRNLFAMEAMWSRHLPHYRFLDALVQEGALGALRSVQADHGQLIPHVPRLVLPELGGGALLDLGVYPIHMENMMLGGPDRVESISRMSDRGVDIADMVVGHYDRADDAALSVATCSLDASTPMGMVAAFHKGLVEIPLHCYSPAEIQLSVHSTDGEIGPITSTRTATWDARVPGGFQYQAAEAARRIRMGDLQSPSVPWSATLEVMDVMDQVLKNAGYIGR